MNINQAKVVAGIPKGQSVSGREKLVAAIEHCKRGMVAAHPDRPGGNTARAAELSEAREVFKRRLGLRGNHCPKCFQPIGANATYCQIHSRPQKKMFAAPAGLKPIKQDWRKGKANARISVVTNPLALGGYYTPPVQKVVSKWRGTIVEETLKGYFVAVWPVARHKGTCLNIKGVEPKDWPAVFELGLAVCSVYGNKNKLPFWLLTLPIHVAPNFRFPSYGDIAATIRNHSGKDFTPGAIQKALKSMKLVTGRDETKQVRLDFAKIRALHLETEKVKPQPVETKTA